MSKEARIACGWYVLFPVCEVDAQNQLEAAVEVV